MSAYFERIDDHTFRATSLVQGAWNTQEQHIAPVLGLITHLMERDGAARHAEPMQLSRLSFDILGVLPIDVVDVRIRVLRPGRTIELVEAVLGHGGRAAVIARAWWMQRTDTAALAGTTLPIMPPRAGMDRFHPGEVWPGEFVASVDAYRRQQEPGRAWFWLCPRPVLLADEEISPTARLLGVADITNGMAVRVSPKEVAFPNLDLTAHLFREPEGEWIGADTSVSFGPSGSGLTHTVFSDEHGPVGTSSQSLTVRAVA